MLVESLQNYLAADAGMQGQLGTVAARADGTTGIFPTLAPEQCSMPYVVLAQISGNPLQESMAGTGRLQTERWRFSCYGTTYKKAKKLAKTLIGAMLSMNGAQGSAYVQGCWKKLEADDAEEIPHGTLYKTHCDFSINYTDGDN